jgi:hypothetical protein
MEVAQIDSGAVRAVFITSHALRFVDPRGLLPSWKGRGARPGSSGSRPNGMFASHAGAQPTMARGTSKHLMRRWDCRVAGQTGRFVGSFSQLRACRTCRTGGGSHARSRPFHVRENGSGVNSIHVWTWTGTQSEIDFLRAFISADFELCFRTLVTSRGILSLYDPRRRRSRNLQNS